MAVTSLYYPYHRAVVFLVVALTVVVLGVDHYTSTAQGGGRGGWWGPCGQVQNCTCKHKLVVTIITIINIINPQRMQLYTRSLCVYVYYHASCYIPGLYDANKGAIRLFTAFLKYECVNFIENALFKSSGDIYWPLWPSLLLDEQLIDKGQRWLHFKISSV